MQWHIIYGVPFQAAILAHMGNEKLQVFTLQDVTPIGIEMSIVIPSNTSIPNTKKGHYTTNYDNQTTILYSGYKGERTRTQDDELL